MIIGLIFNFEMNFQRNGSELVKRTEPRDGRLTKAKDPQFRTNFNETYTNR